MSVRHLVFLVSGLPVALASFVLLLSGVGVSAGLAVVWVGFPLALVTLELARQLARFERSRLRWAGIDITAPQPVGDDPHPDRGPWRRRSRVVRDSRAWRDLAHGLLALPLAVATFCVAVTWTAGAVGGLTSWSWSGWLPPTSVTLTEAIGLPLGGAWPDVVLGLLFAATTAPALRLCVMLHAGLARFVLGDDLDVNLSERLRPRTNVS